jgi:hypothetical protein
VIHDCWLHVLERELFEDLVGGTRSAVCGEAALED